MDSSSSPHLTLVDSHVHFYGCFDTERFFAAAFGNIAAQAAARGVPGAAGALLLAETAGGKWFGKVAALADGGGDGPTGPVRFFRTDEEVSVLVKGGRGETLYVVAGSQIATRERLELLALCTAEEFRDGKPVETVLDEVLQAGGLPVLPWGAGKWLGARGGIVTELLGTWKEKGLRCADSGLAADLKRYLSEEAAAAVPYGKPAGLLHFLSTQMRLRLGPCRKEGAAG